MPFDKIKDNEATEEHSLYWVIRETDATTVVSSAEPELSVQPQTLTASADDILLSVQPQALIFSSANDSLLNFFFFFYDLFHFSTSMSNIIQHSI